MGIENGVVDKRIPVPLYYQLKQIILDEIMSGALKPGDMLPPEVELQKMFELSSTTVRQAMKELVMEGYVTRIKSKGTFISNPRTPQLILGKLGSFREEMQAQGFAPGIKVLTRGVTAAYPREVAAFLKLTKEQQAFCYYGVRYADDEPVLIENLYVPAHLVDAERFDLQEQKFYTLLAENKATEVVRSERVIESQLAKEEEHKLLDVPIGSPIQSVTIMDYNAMGEPCVYGILRYRGDRNKFQVTLVTEPKK